MDLSIFHIGMLIVSAVPWTRGSDPTATANFWQSLPPGELLQRLDRMTADAAQAIDAPLQLLPTAPAALPAPPTSEALSPLVLPPQPAKKRRAATRYDASDEASSEDDYDHAYEQFVRQYFGKASADAFDSADEGSSETEAYSSAEALAAPLAAGSRRKAKKKCSKVRKNGQDCVVCRNDRNGEKSETCSYSRESEPQGYAYERERNYRKQRDEPPHESTEDSGEDELGQSDEEDDDAAEAKESKVKKNAGDKRKRPTTAKSSSCIKRVKGGENCYHCRNADGEKRVKCFQRKSDGADGKQRNSQRNLQKTQQRIYKRTVSYEYEKDTMPGLHGSTSTDDDFGTNATATKKPQLRRKYVVKIVKTQRS